MDIFDRIAPNLKVAILAAGGASRMQPLSGFVAKPMVPIGDEPLLGRIFDSFIQAGIFHFIVCYGVHEDQVVPFCEQYPHRVKGITVEVVRQGKPMGMADAVQLTEKLVYPTTNSKQFPFIVTAGDILFSPTKIRSLIYTHLNSHAEMTLALAHSTDGRMANGYGNVKLNGEKVVQIVEKPGENNKIDDYYSEPMYVFNYGLFQKLPAVKPSKRGERELQDAMQMIIDDNAPIAGMNVIEHSIGIPEDGQYHITYPRDFLAMNNRLLDQIPLNDSNVEGFIIAPVAGSPGLVGESSKVGPNVFLGNDSRIGNESEISETYVFPKANIHNNCRLRHCIVFQGVEVNAGTVAENKIFLPSGIFDLK